MSIPAMNWCIQQNNLPAGEWVVLFHLAHCHNHQTGRCDPSQEYLSTMTNMSERTVRRHLVSLESQRLIHRKKRGVAGGGRMSDFFVLGHETDKLTANVTGKSMRTNRTNRVQNRHGMSGKQEEQGKQEEPPMSPLGENNPMPNPKLKKPKVPIPEDWTPNEANIQHALSKNFSLEEISYETEQFRDHHIAKGTMFADRDAAWRAWIGKALKFAGRRTMAGGAHGGGGQRGGSFADEAARREGERRLQNQLPARPEG